MIYLDHAATTPMRASAIDAMMPYLADCFANPSGSHRFAREARRAVDEARDQVADVIGFAPGEIVFTSGGTESDNLAIAGLADRAGAAVCSAAEHHAVLHPVERAEGRVVGVDSEGSIDLDQLAAALDDDTRIVSVMAVNNEVGTITDLGPVADLVRRLAPNAVLHSDVVQAAAWLDLRPIAALVDAMSLSGHKLGGPKGVGVLALRRGINIEPLMVGGGQERELRPGTHNVAGIVGFAEALRETDEQRSDHWQHCQGLRDRLLDGMAAQIDLIETVPRHRSVAGAAHICLSGVESEALLYLLDRAEVYASAASACASGAMEPSHVLAAMGVDRSVAAGALRMSLGRTTTDSDIDAAIVAVTEAVTRLRDRAPDPLARR